MEGIKNLYFKSWFLPPEEIEARLRGLDIPWRRLDTKFFFFVTPETMNEVRAKIEGLNKENGSILFDSDIDYVFCTPDEIAQQLRKKVGDEYVLRG